MICKTRAELPAEYGCLKCDATKPIAEMMLVRTRRTGEFRLRPRCKKCNNAQEKGHRRAWKTKYLRRWRKDNAEINESYWRQSAVANRPVINQRARQRLAKYHHAILIQGRLRRRLKMRVPLKEAVALLEKYGPCYPTLSGLTPDGRRECERIRSAQRRRPKHKRYSLVEIRMMIYEDGYYKSPSRQRPPYQKAAKRLSQWQRQQGHGLALAA